MNRVFGLLLFVFGLYSTLFALGYIGGVFLSLAETDLYISLSKTVDPYAPGLVKLVLWAEGIGILLILIGLTQNRWNIWSIGSWRMGTKMVLMVGLLVCLKLGWYMVNSA